MLSLSRQKSEQNYLIWRFFLPRAKIINVTLWLYDLQFQNFSPSTHKKRFLARELARKLPQRSNRLPEALRSVANALAISSSVGQSGQSGSISERPSGSMYLIGLSKPKLYGLQLAISSAKGSGESHLLITCGSGVASEYNGKYSCNLLYLTPCMQEKQTIFTPDKILPAIVPPDRAQDLRLWADMYLHTHVAGGSENTLSAKTGDLAKLLEFLQQTFSGDPQKDTWTPSISKAFKKSLTAAGYKPSSMNRVLATLRHFAGFVHGQAPFVAGDPFAGVKDVSTEEPVWNGLTNRQLSLCRAAIDVRLATCKRKNQNPLFEAAIFYTLLHTGLRSFELTSLLLSQYYTGGFHQVERKGDIITRKVNVPAEARHWLDRYLYEIRLAPFRKKGLAALLSPDQLTGGVPRSGLAELLAMQKGEYIFVPGRDPETLKQNKPISERSLREMMERISNQASAQLPDNEKFHLSPHMLRHSFGKRIADKYGIHVAQAMLGNVSTKEVYRYTRPSPEEMGGISENLYE